MDLKLHHFKALVALATAGSLREAALLAGVSKSALSKTLQEAQEISSDPLFTRRDGRLVPSSLGELAVVRARSIIASMEEAVAEVRKFADERRLHVSVAIAQPAGCAAVPQALRWFRARFPDVDLALYDTSSVQVLTGLRSSALDFAITDFADGLREEEFEHEALGAFAQSVVGRVGSPPAMASDAKTSDWICSQGTGPGTVSRFLQLFDDAGLPRPPSLISADYFVAHEMLLNSNALSVWPDLLTQLVGSPDLAPVSSPTLRLRPVQLHLSRRRDVPLTDTAAYFSECLAEATHKAAAGAV